MKTKINIISMLLCLTLSQNILAEEDDDLFDDMDDEEDEVEVSTCRNNGNLQFLHSQRNHKTPLQKKDAIFTTAHAEVQNVCDFTFPTLLNIRIEKELLGIQNKGDVLQLREGHARFSYQFDNGNFIEAKIGRQFLSIGVADFLLLNSHQTPFNWKGVFTGNKYSDWQIGGDRIKLSFKNNWFGNLSLVTGKFIPSELPNGKRIAYFHPLLGSLTNQEMDIEKRDRKLEYSFKYERRLYDSKINLYGYKGFYHSPLGINSSFKFFYPKLESWGMSMIQTTPLGIFKMESVSLKSVENKDGSNPFLPTTEGRYLVSLEKEVVTHVTLSGQFYQEVAPKNSVIKKTWTGTFAMRIMLFSNKLTLSSFYAQDENKESYLRGYIGLKYDDNLSFRLGGNIFKGKKSGRFGQLTGSNNTFLIINYDN
jgi:hypothetical protein